MDDIEKLRSAFSAAYDAARALNRALPFLTEEPYRDLWTKTHVAQLVAADVEAALQHRLYLAKQEQTKTDRR